jgi:hypothetical protein
MTAWIERLSPSSSVRVAAWAAVGFAVYLVVGYVSLLVVAVVEDVVLDPIGLGGEPGTSSWGAILATHPVVWAAMTVAIATWLGRRLLPDAVHPGISSVAHLLGGTALAVVSMYLLHEFALARYGWFDPDYVGVTVFAPSALVAIGLAGWAAAAIDREHRGLLVGLQIAALVGLGIAFLPSLPGVQDGIRASSIPLAVVFVLDAGFALVSVVSSVLSTGAKAAREG